MQFWDLYHHSSKDRAKGHPPIPADSSQWPEEWKRISYKTYPRLPRIPLERESLSADLGQALFSRASRRKFTGEPLGKKELSSLLLYSCGISQKSDLGFARRTYPSGGARFPLEVYLVLFKGSDDVPAGLYHYDVANHQLEVLLQRSFSREDIQALCIDKEWKYDCAGMFVMTGIFARTLNKYGERGYRYVLQETGHVGQNLYLTAEALKLNCCAIGSAEDTAIEELLDIDGKTESVIYSLAIGK
jgi:SagB-type dehydrogenase family enzyme